MKKIILIMIILLSQFNFVNASNYDYNYKGKIYYIYYPENIEFLEYQYLTGKLNENNKYYKVVYLNILLVKYGLDPIY